MFALGLFPLVHFRFKAGAGTGSTELRRAESRVKVCGSGQAPSYQLGKQMAVTIRRRPTCSSASWAGWRSPWAFGGRPGHQLHDERPVWAFTNERIDRVIRTAQKLVDESSPPAEAVAILRKTARRRKDLLRAGAVLRSRRFVTDDRRTWLTNQYLLAAFHETDVVGITAEQDDWFARMDALIQAGSDDAIYARLLAGIPGLADVEHDVLGLAREPLAPSESLQSRKKPITEEIRARTTSLLGPEATPSDPIYQSRTALHNAERVISRKTTRAMFQGL